MVENSKNLKKNFLTEEDISTILQRYTATTVLALLQEVAQVQSVKIDWDELVKRTTTGISNAREYQMLWRHLAYHDSMMDRMDDAAQPLDDDSDLECEVEAFPGVSTEASAEAAACVKVLIASGISNDPTGSTVEAPLTISIPKGQMSKAPENSLSTNCTLGTNITVPISVQKQPMPTNNNAEGLDSNGAANANLPRRKRKPWSSTEDLELIAAVQKCGEGNWANILKGDFKGDRTASQLSQRWSILKKRHGNLNVGTGSQISEIHLATRRAVSMALGESPIPSSSIANGANSNVVHSNLGQPAGTEASPSAIPSLPSSQHDAALTGALGPMGSSKARIAPKKPSTTTKTALSPESMVSKSNLNPDAMPSKATVSPDSLVKAAAFAAGARIATPSDAASLLKAAQSKNAVHIMPGGSLVKSSVAGTSNSLPSNVHFIRTGLVSRPLSSYSTAPANVSQPSVTHQVQGPSAKPTATVICSNSGAGAPDLSPTSETKSTGISVLPRGPDVRTVEKSSCTKTVKEHVLDGEVGLTTKAPNNQMEADQHTVSNNSPMDVEVSANSLKDELEGDQPSVITKSLEEQDGREKASLVEALKVKEDQIDSKSSSLRAANGHHDVVGNDKSEISSVENNSEIPLANEGNHENGSVLQMKEGPEEMVVDGNEGEKVLSHDGTCNEGTV